MKPEKRSPEGTYIES